MHTTNPFEGLDRSCINLIQGKARRLAHHPYFSISDVEDIESELAIHLRQQSHKYDPKRGSYRTFASRILDHRTAAMIAERRTRHFNHTVVSLDLMSAVDEETPDATGKNVITQMIDAQNQEFTLVVALRIDLINAMRHLTPQQTELCHLLASGWNVSECSQAMGISRDSVYELKRQIQHQFRRLALDAHL